MIEAKLAPANWYIGEHIAVTGENGSGKTFLMSQLVNYRRYVIILRTKPDDIVFKGFKHVKDAKGINIERNGYRLLVDLTKMRTLRWSQGVEARAVLDSVWKMGRWTIFLDEAFWLQKKLGLQDDLEALLTQGRSLGISIVVGMQRPAWVTRFALSEAKHVFSFRSEGRDMKTIGESTNGAMADAVRKLPRFHFAHFYRPTGEIRIGEAHSLPQVLRIAA